MVNDYFINQYKFNIYIIYNMPAKMNMFLANVNQPSLFLNKQINTSSLGGIRSTDISKASSAINAPMIGRIHNVKAGCGSCGRH